MKFPISTSIGLFISSLFLGTVFSPNQIAKAQNCNYYAGKAVGGQSVNVDLCSISRASYKSIDFVYYLGEKRVESQANCEAGNWTTFPEKTIHRPQSPATQNMLDVVCQYRNPTTRAGVAIVFDPPSNVRKYPNGEVLCSVRSRTNINIYGSIGEWYYTDVCGQIGVIHSSQVRF
ncbi:MAG: hypothetical protein RLZZ338_1889 [Cyanobacteriota bacterium]|jgi:hypothetical protein